MMTIKENAAVLMSEVREKNPLIHNITNYVTVNDVANAVLAIGASPIMADDIEEAADISAISSALVLNIGTLNQRTLASMVTAGKRANDLGIPVIFDPVGAGASRLRNDSTATILSKVKVDILRGNLSELSFVAGLSAATKGVDVSEADAGNDGKAVAAAVSQRCGCVSALTGAVDIITDGRTVVEIHNGRPMLSKVTGTGCMSSALVGAFAAASFLKNHGAASYLAAAAAGVAAMGIAGEIAWERAGQLGTGSFHIGIIDALSNLTAADFTSRARFEEKREGGK